MKYSNYIYDKALELIPEASQTKSKMACRFPNNYPKFIGAGHGARVEDLDGNIYIDWVMGLGPVILGHGYQAVADACHTQALMGNVFALPNPLEYELAQALCVHIPSAEMVRFGRNGGDVTAGAVRLARAITGRTNVYYCGYHGGQDWFAHEVIPNKGTIPQPVYPFIYNDTELLKELISGDKPACVIMEISPVPPKDGWLQEVIDLTHEAGALFILDEIVTWPRYGMGGAQEVYNIVPDLTTISKALGNGFPISALVGKREYMERFDEIFFSTTFGGELTGIVAGLTTTNICHRQKVPDHINRIGSALRASIVDLMEEYEIDGELLGNPARSILNFNNDPHLIKKTVFLQQLIERGVLMGVPIFPCFTHTMEDVHFTVNAIGGAFNYMYIHRNDPDYGLIGSPISMIGSPRK